MWLWLHPLRPGCQASKVPRIKQNEAKICCFAPKLCLSFRYPLRGWRWCLCHEEIESIGIWHDSAFGRFSLFTIFYCCILLQSATHSMLETQPATLTALSLLDLPRDSSQWQARQALNQEPNDQVDLTQSLSQSSIPSLWMQVPLDYIVAWWLVQGADIKCDNWCQQRCVHPFLRVRVRVRISIWLSLCPKSWGGANQKWHISSYTDGIHCCDCQSFSLPSHFGSPQRKGHYKTTIDDQNGDESGVVGW